MQAVYDGLPTEGRPAAGTSGPSMVAQHGLAGSVTKDHLLSVHDAAATRRHQDSAPESTREGMAPEAPREGMAPEATRGATLSHESDIIIEV